MPNPTSCKPEKATSVEAKWKSLVIKKINFYSNFTSALKSFWFKFWILLDLVYVCQISRVVSTRLDAGNHLAFCFLMLTKSSTINIPQQSALKMIKKEPKTPLLTLLELFSLHVPCATVIKKRSLCKVEWIFKCLYLCAWKRSQSEMYGEKKRD